MIRTLIAVSTEVTDMRLPSPLVFGPEIALDRGTEGTRIDRFRQIALKADAEQPLPITRHRQRGHGHYREVRQIVALADLANDRLPAAARDLHVQHQQIEADRRQRATRLL